MVQVVVADSYFSKSDARSHSIGAATTGSVSLFPRFFDHGGLFLSLGAVRSCSGISVAASMCGSKPR